MIERRPAGESEPRDGEPRDGEPPAGEPRDGEPPASEPRDGEPPLEIDGQEVDTGPGRAREALDRIRAASAQAGESAAADRQPVDGEPPASEPRDGEPPLEIDGQEVDTGPGRAQEALDRIRAASAQAGESAAADRQPVDGEPLAGEPRDSEPLAGEPRDSEPAAPAREPEPGSPEDQARRAEAMIERRPAGESEPRDGEPRDGEPPAGEPRDGEPPASEPRDGEPPLEIDGQEVDTGPGRAREALDRIRAASAQAGESAAADRQPVDGEPLAGEPRDSEPLAGEPRDSEPAAPAREPEPGSPEDQARRAEAMIERRPAGESEPRDGEPRDGEPPAGEPRDGEPPASEPRDGEPPAGEPRDGEPPASEPRDGEPPLEIDGQEVDTGPGRAREALDRIRDRLFGAQSERGPDGGRISGDEEVTRALGVSDEARDRVIARRQETDPDFDQEDANFHYLYGLVRRIDEGRSEDEIAEEFGISRERVADFVDRQPRAIDTGRQLIREGQSDPELDNEFRAARDPMDRDSIEQEPADRDPMDRDPMDRDPIEQEPADRDPGQSVRDPAAPEPMDGDPDGAPTTETDAEAAVRRIRSGEDRDDALEGAAVVAVSALSLRPRQEAYVNRRMRESARGFGADLGEEPRVNAAVLPDGTAVLYTEVDGQTLVTELPQTTFTRPIVRAASARAGEPAAADRQPVDGEPLAGEPRDSEPLAGEPRDSEPAAPAREPEPGSPEDQARRAEAMIERRLAGESEPRDGEPPAGEPRDGEPPLEIDGQEVDTGPGRAQEALDRIRAGVPAGRALDDAETASLEDALQSPRQRNYFAVRLERAAAQTNRPLQGDYEISAAVFDDDTVLVYAEQDGRAVAIPLTQQDALTDTVDRVRDHVRANPAVRPAGSPDTDHNDISDNVLQPVEEVGQPTAHDVSELVAAQRAEIRAAVDRVDDDRASVDERGMLLARDVHTRLDALRVPHPDDVETPEELNSASADYLEDLRSLRDEVRARLVAEPALERQHVGELADTLDRAVDAAEEQMGERSVRHAGEAAEDLTVGSPSPRDSAADNLRAFARQQRDARAGRDAGDPAPDPVDPAAPADPAETAPAVVATEQGQVAAGDAPSTQSSRQPRIADVRAARETVHDSVEDALSAALDDESLDPAHRDTLRSLQRDLPAVASDEGQARNNAHNVRLLSAELRHQREQLGPEAAEASHPLNRVHQALSEAEEFVDESFPNLPPTTALAAAPTRAPDGTPLAGTGSGAGAGAGAGVGPTGAVAGPVARAGDAARARLLANTLTTRRIEAVRPDIGAELITAVHEAFPEDGASSVELETRNTLMRHARAVQAGGDPSLPNADAARVLNRQLSTFNRAAQTAGIRNPDLQERVDVVQESLQGVYSTLSRPSDLDTLVERQETSLSSMRDERLEASAELRERVAARRREVADQLETEIRRIAPTTAALAQLDPEDQRAIRAYRAHIRALRAGPGDVDTVTGQRVGEDTSRVAQFLESDLLALRRLNDPGLPSGRGARNVREEGEAGIEELFRNVNPAGTRGSQRFALRPEDEPGPVDPTSGIEGLRIGRGAAADSGPALNRLRSVINRSYRETLPLLRELSEHQQQIEARQRPFITPGDLPAVPTRRRDQGSLLEQRQRRLSAEASGEPGAVAVTPQENEALRARALAELGQDPPAPAPDPEPQPEPIIGPPDPSAPAPSGDTDAEMAPGRPGRARGVSRASALGTVLRETDDLGVLRETEQAPLTQLNSGVREALGLREGDETSDVRGAVANDGSVLVYRVDADGLLVNFAILQSEADRQSVRNQVGAFRIEERAASRGGRRRGRRGGSRRLAGLRTRQEQEAAAAAQSAAEAAAVRARVEEARSGTSVLVEELESSLSQVRGASDVPGLTARPAGHQSIRRQTPLSDRAGRVRPPGPFVRSDLGAGADVIPDFDEPASADRFSSARTIAGLRDELRSLVNRPGDENITDPDEVVHNFARRAEGLSQDLIRGTRRLDTTNNPRLREFLNDLQETAYQARLESYRLDPDRHDEPPQRHRPAGSDPQRRPSPEAQAAAEPTFVSSELRREMETGRRAATPRPRAPWRSASAPPRPAARPRPRRLPPPMPTLPSPRARWTLTGTAPPSPGPTSWARAPPPSPPPTTCNPTRCWTTSRVVPPNWTGRWSSAAPRSASAAPPDRCRARTSAAPPPAGPTPNSADWNARPAPPRPRPPPPMLPMPPRPRPRRNAWTSSPATSPPRPPTPTGRRTCATPPGTPPPPPPPHPWNGTTPP